MSEEKREPKSTDQEKAEEAYKLLEQFFKKHQFMEGALMLAAMFTHIAENYKNSGISYDHFCDEIRGMMKHYKYVWE